MSAATRRWAVPVAVAAVALLAVNEVRIASALAASQGLAPAAVFSARIGPWVAAIGVLAIYSFLVAENAFYRLFEHALLGTALGFGAVVLFRQVILEKWWNPMVRAVAALITRNPDVGSPAEIWLVIPGIIGLLWYFQFSRRYLWLNRIAVAVTVGGGAGLAIKRSFFELLPQVTKSFKPVVVLPSADIGIGSALLISLENCVFLAAVVSVLFYFFFAISQKRAAVRGTARLGRWFLMITLGAFFGNTFMTRLSAFIERVHFLLAEWLMVVGK